MSTELQNHSSDSPSATKPRIVIEYCPKCRWLLRSAWMAQELLTTFEQDVKEVALRPSEISGMFSVTVDDISVWSRKEMSRFPEIKELKQLVRDIVAPDKDLGHSDKKEADV